MTNQLRSALALMALALSLATLAPAARAGDAASKPEARAAEVPVAAAASLRLALDEIAKAFEARTGHAIRISYGATGNLVRQIEEGAPFELFLAADEAAPARLQKRGKTEGPAMPLVDGRLSIAVPKGSPVKLDGKLSGLKQALADGTATNVAIANPELAPYGKAAREAMQNAGVWEAAQPRLVQGENIGQAAQFVATGAAQVGLVAQSLMFAPDMAAKVDHLPVDASLYAPIRQGMALLKTNNPASKAFYAFLTSPEAAAVFEKNGFSVPR